MPNHQYRCTNNHHWDHHDREGDPVCPYCGCTQGVKVPAKNTFVLKGSGWAKDGYRGKA